MIDILFSILSHEIYELNVKLFKIVIESLRKISLIVSLEIVPSKQSYVYSPLNCVPNILTDKYPLEQIVLSLKVIFWITLWIKLWKLFSGI